MFPGLPPLRRRARAVRHQLRRRRRLIAAVLATCATVAGVRAVAPPPPETVAVLVAARDLPSGTVLARDDVVRRDYPADLAPDAAATSPVGRVLAAPLARGAVVTDVGVVGPGLARAEPGRVVLPVRLPDAGMTALLRAGDLVDLMATDPGTGVTTTVASGVTVLATPRGVPEGPAGGAGGALVVVAATPADAVEITGAALSQYLTIALDR